MFSAGCLSAMMHHAVKEYPRESVGIVVSGEYFPLKNESPEPDQVLFDDRMALCHGSNLQAIIHSHPGENAWPSYQDQVSQMAWDIPWGIVVCNQEKAQLPFFWGDGAPRPPIFVDGKFQQRAFRWAVDDCYSLIRDAYRELLGIKLPNFAREWGDWYGDPPFSGYDTYFREAGFERIENPQDYDLAVMRLGDIAVPSHAGVLLPGNMLLHHLGDADEPYCPARLSAREPLGRWSRCVKYGGYWLRHRERK